MSAGQENVAESVKPGRKESPALPLWRILEELKQHLELIEDGDYENPVSTLFTSSPGAQVRHTLDHVAALVHGCENGIMDYEFRERGGAVETCRKTALSFIGALQQKLLKIDGDRLSRPVTARLLLDPAGEILEHPSSISREIAFVLSHTVHHNAILVSMFRSLGIRTSDSFGYAPATLQYQSSMAD